MLFAHMYAACSIRQHEKHCGVIIIPFIVDESIANDTIFVHVQNDLILIHFFRVELIHN